MRRLFAFLLGMPLVWTVDSDGDVRLRIVTQTGCCQCHRKYHVSGIVSSTRGRLDPDGTIYDGSYMRKWHPANTAAIKILNN